MIRKSLRKSSFIFGDPRVSLYVSSLTAGCIEGIPGHYGMFWGVPGVFRGVPGVFRVCSGVFQCVPGCSGFYRHPKFTREIRNRWQLLVSIGLTLQGIFLNFQEHFLCMNSRLVFKKLFFTIL